MQEATDWGKTINSVNESLRPPLRAWVESGDYVAEGSSDLPSLADFEDRFAGEWGSFTDFAQNLAEEIGLFSDVPEAVSRYFDWKSWTRDLAFDFTVADAPGGGVFVFRNFF